MFDSISKSTRVGIFNSEKSFRECPNFLRYNLIYGFNGSGKSTFSRILSSICNNNISDKLPPSSKFDLRFSGVIIRSADLPQDNPPNNVLVFNRDFIEVCLDFKAANAKPIVYLGKEMKDIASTLDSKSASLEASKSREDSLILLESSASKSLTIFKKLTAKSIKEGAKFSVYDARHLDKRLEELTTKPTVSNDNRYSAEKVIADTDNKPKLKTVDFAKVIDLLLRVFFNFNQIKITLSQSVKVDISVELLRWLESGISLHQDASNCAFCENPLAKHRVQELNAIFDSTSNHTDSLISETLNELASCKTLLQEMREFAPDTADLFSEFREKVASEKPKLYDLIRDGSNALIEIEPLLHDASRGVPFITPPSSEFSKITALVEALKDSSIKIHNEILLHNERHDEFITSYEQAQAVKSDSIIAEAWSELKQLRKSHTDSVNALLEEQTNRANLIHECAILQGQLANTSNAAAAINSLLNEYFGHKRIALLPTDSGYCLSRSNGDEALQLSEGEKTALSLCYFLSKLQEDGRSIKDTVVVIDDPISSLDTNAKNFAHALIKSKCDEARQVFILTHDMHFMNETKKWLKNRHSPRQEVGKPEKAKTAQFLQIRSEVDLTSEKRCSRIGLMSDLLVEYDSDYQYNFAVLFRNTLPPGPDGRIYDFFIIPNLARKVLETFFAFKLPGARDLPAAISNKVYREAGFDKAKSESLVRFLNVESHAQSLESLTSTSAISYEEAIDSARFIMEIIETLDETHFKEMVKKCRRVSTMT